MNKLTAAILLATAIPLARCATTTTTTTTPATAASPSVTTTTATGPLGNIAAFTQADLTTAIAQAQKAGVAGQPIVSCFTFLQNNLTALQGTSLPTGGTVGAATAFTTAYLGLNNATAALSQTSQQAYAMACGPLVVMTANQGMSLVSQVSALAALLGK